MIPEPETKTLSLELKADSEGAFSATFATLNVIDHHGDVTLPGAFTDGKEVLIGGYQHDMLSLPVGKGVIRSNDSRAYVEGSFFLDTQIGKDTYATVKNAGGLMEWSYVFQVKDSADGEFDTGSGSVPVRFLKSLDVWSVDPVLKGAGIGTRTDSIKALAREMPFAGHASELMAALDAFATRAKTFADLRTKEGRTLSTANVEKLMSMAESLSSHAKLIQQMCADATPSKSIDLESEYLKFQRAQSLLAGVL